MNDDILKERVKIIDLKSSLQTAKATIARQRLSNIRKDSEIRYLKQRLIFIRTTIEKTLGEENYEEQGR